MGGEREGRKEEEMEKEDFGPSQCWKQIDATGAGGLTVRCV